MDRYHRIRRLRADLTALPGIALAYTVADPADCRGTSGSQCSWHATARAPEWDKHPPLPVHSARISTVVAGIAPWQIALIAAAALLATALAVIAGRRRRARRRQTATA